MSGPTLFWATGRIPDTAAAFTADGWYRTGDIGRLDACGHLILMGRTKDIIVLPNGLNVYPEDIENALRVAGIRDTVVLETAPGRIEAVVLAPGSRPCRAIPGDAPGGSPAPIRPRPNGPRSRRAGQGRQRRRSGRISGSSAGVWPDADFPRTHTLKVKRDRSARGQPGAPERTVSSGR